MSEVVKTLNATEIASAQRQAEAIANVSHPRLDVSSGEHFVWTAHFDGTNNDKGNLKLAASKHDTNVAQLWAQSKALDIANANFSSHYFRGVGTDPGVKGSIDVVDPTSDMRATASEAYDFFRREASEWLSKHPNANPEEALQIMGTGFSRGGGTLAVFSQLLYERGLVDPQTHKVLVPPGRLGLAGAFVMDPVTTGYVGNDAFSPTSRNINVVRADNEYRGPFRLTDHSGNPNVHVHGMTGNHCGIGGGYDRGTEALVLQAATRWLQKSGLPIDDVADKRKFDGQAKVYHERDMPHTEYLAPPAYRFLPERVRGFLGNKGGVGLDYPVTHEPRNGLHAPRETAGDVENARLLPSGWTRFKAMDSTVYSKAYTDPATGEKSAVSVVYRNHGRGSQVDVYTSQLNDDGHVVRSVHQSMGHKPLSDVMTAVDDHHRSPDVATAQTPTVQHSVSQTQAPAEVHAEASLAR